MGSAQAVNAICHPQPFLGITFKNEEPAPNIKGYQHADVVVSAQAQVNTDSLEPS